MFQIDKQKTFIKSKLLLTEQYEALTRWRAVDSAINNICIYQSCPVTTKVFPLMRRLIKNDERRVYHDAINNTAKEN